VYYPLGHWVWGSGWLSPAYGLFGEKGVVGVYDFAGGIVIHTSAGVASFICALVLGHRKGFKKNHNGQFPASNLPLAVIGATLLWVGWFGFNGGSALTSGTNSAFAIINSQIAACLTGCIWLFGAIYEKKPGVAPLLNGAIAGLAGITPAAGFITPLSTIVLSIILGFATYFGVKVLKDVLYVDDASDVTIVHGLTGIIGSIMVGFAASTEINPSGPSSVIYGYPKQLGYQLLGVVVAVAWSAFFTFVILKFINATVGLKVTLDEEEKGLDLVEHGEVAYHYLMREVVEKDDKIELHSTETDKEEKDTDTDKEEKDTGYFKEDKDTGSERETVTSNSPLHAFKEDKDTGSERETATSNSPLNVDKATDNNLDVQN